MQKALHLQLVVTEGFQPQVGKKNFEPWSMVIKRYGAFVYITPKKNEDVFPIINGDFPFQSLCQSSFQQSGPAFANVS